MCYETRFIPFRQTLFSRLLLLKCVSSQEYSNSSSVQSFKSVCFQGVYFVVVCYAETKPGFLGGGGNGGIDLSCSFNDTLIQRKRIFLQLDVSYVGQDTGGILWPSSSSEISKTFPCQSTDALHFKYNIRLVCFDICKIHK